jgi:hypothetical protein
MVYRNWRCFLTLPVSPTRPTSSLRLACLPPPNPPSQPSGATTRPKSSVPTSTRFSPTGTHADSKLSSLRPTRPTTSSGRRARRTRNTRRPRSLRSRPLSSPARTRSSSMSSSPAGQNDGLTQLRSNRRLIRASSSSCSYPQRRETPNQSRSWTRPTLSRARS